MTTKILVIDDEPAIGRLLMYQLHEFGYQVSYVQDGLTGLQRLSREQPDLILLDVVLPLMSGWDVAKQIRTISAVPIIMLTGKNADSDIVAGLAAGADDYISKPFNLAQLQARIEAVLRRTANDPGRRSALVRNMGGEPRSADQDARHPEPHPVSDNRPAVDLGVDTPAIGVGAHPVPVSRPDVPTTPPAEAQAVPTVRVGYHFREARLARGISLSQAGQACNVRWEFLQAIEQENFNYIPRSQLRVSLRSYASYLGLDLNGLMGKPARVLQAPVQRQRSPLPIAALATVLVLLLVVGLVLLQTV